MSHSQPEPNDSVEALRQRLGIQAEAPKIIAGPVVTQTFDERAKRHEEEMRRMADEGYDYSGLGMWRRLMRRVGRAGTP